MKRLRYQAAEYLRRGIEEVRAAAGYIFRNNPKQMERYPSLFVRKRRKTDKVKTADEASADSVAPAPAIAPSESDITSNTPPRASDDVGASPELG